jgi:hypothetical protein
MIDLLEVRLIRQRQHTADDWVDVVQAVPHLDSDLSKEFGPAELKMQLVQRSVVPRQLVMMSDEELRWITQMADRDQRSRKRPHGLDLWPFVWSFLPPAPTSTDTSSRLAFFSSLHSLPPSLDRRRRPPRTFAAFLHERYWPAAATAAQRFGCRGVFFVVRSRCQRHDARFVSSWRRPAARQHRPQQR